MIVSFNFFLEKCDLRDLVILGRGWFVKNGKIMYFLIVVVEETSV